MAGSRYKRARSDGAAPAKKRRRVAPKPSRRAASTFPVETKYFDTSFTQSIANGADWTGTEVACSNYIQSDGTTVGAYTDSALLPSAVGSGYGQVVGTKYALKALRVRGSLTSNIAADQADVPVPASVTIALVQDTQPNGAQAQGEEVYTDMGAATQVNFSFQAMGAGAGGRFKILKRKTFILQPQLAGTDGTNTNSVVLGGTQFNFEHQWRKPLVTCIKGNSATPTTASLSDNNIFMLAHCSSQSNAVIMNGCARAYYLD